MTKVIGFLERLNNEKDELEEKTTKLDSFIDTPAFYELLVYQQGLLKIQLKAMNTYFECLQLRLDILK